MAARCERCIDGFEWSINEKVAAEAAAGVSAAGGRAALVFKQCGLNIAFDPLMNAAHHTIGGGIVVLVGDDVNAASSTVMQDSRLLAQAAGIPLFELSDERGSVDTLIADAFALSESARLPVVVRFTAELHTKTVLGSHGAGAIPTTSVRFAVDTDRAHRLTKLGRHQAHRLHSWPRVEEAAGSIAVTGEWHRDDCAVGLLRVGSAGGHVDQLRELGCLMQVQVSWPVAKAMHAFVDGHQKTVVVEEPRAFVERELRMTAPENRVQGRLTGHLLPEGGLTSDDVVRALDDAVHAGEAWRRIDVKAQGNAGPPPPYDTLFRALSALASDGHFVSTDVGSSVKLCYPPYEAATVALCLGGSIGVAAGYARHSGTSAIAVIGDYGLLHSGIESLVELSYRRVPAVVVVLSNGISAQTGGQRTAASDCDTGVRLEPLVRACGISSIDHWWVDDLSPAETATRLDELAARSAPSVVFVSEGAGVAGLQRTQS